jgi:two-component system OmpR family response regulator
VVVDLSVREFDLLITFLEAPRQVLSREYLLDAARSNSLELFDRVIDVQISRLRRKIKGGTELIQTVRGAGYMFAADVEKIG